MKVWETWKTAFDRWEGATAKVLEQAMQSRTLLAPAGTVLSAAMRARAGMERAGNAWWGALGLPTKTDQERTLHALNELQSQLFDLEEKLAALEEHGEAKRETSGPPQHGEARRPGKKRREARERQRIT